MHEYLHGLFVVSCSACVRVVDSAAAVCVGVDKEEYSIAWDIPGCVLDGLDVACCEIAVKTEGVVTGLECSILVNSCT